MTKFNRLKIAFLYFFMLTGGLWHILNVLQETMSLLAGPLLIGLGIWLYYEIRKSEKKKNILKFNIWAVIVVISSFVIEWFGIKSGMIFGEYSYGATLWPQIMSVPIAIGFAWFTMLICSIALMQRLPVINNSNVWIQLLVISSLMTFFDYMMEPAAIQLNYWNWQSETVPVQNYIAWFVISFLLLIIAKQMNILKIKIPVIVVHAYFTQLLYFIMIIFK